MQKLHTPTAGDLGRMAGTLVRHLCWLNDQIDWAEVAAIVIHGLKILVVLTLMAGRATRRAWDGLPGFSERLGKAYAALLVPSIPGAPLVALKALPLVPELEVLAAAARALLANWIAQRRQSLEAYLALA
jgi:hypothetical protein